MDAVQQFSQIKPKAALAFLGGVNQQGATTWGGCVWPNRKAEDWQYTSLRALEKRKFTAKAVTAEVTLDELQASYEGLDMSGQRVVFVDGAYSAELSDVSESVATIAAFSKAEPDAQKVIQDHLNSAVINAGHLFAALNDQGLAEGLLVHVPAGHVLDSPIHVVYVNTPQAVESYSDQRLLVVLEDNASAQIIEHCVSVGTTSEHHSFSNGLTELCLGAGAKLDHYRLNLEHESVVHIAGVHAVLERSAELNSFYMAKGSELKRLDVVVSYLGEGGHANLNGIYLPRGNQHVDFHTCIEHRVPHCTTQEVFRGIVGDTAKAVFNGRIHIHKYAQKTLAQLSNKNLLTSNKAQVNTKPELEIYADDVQCAHGATVAQIDEAAMHYLRTRGVSQTEAEVMLSFGFINELVNTVKLEPVANYLRPQLAEHFARDPQLTRHIG